MRSKYVNRIHYIEIQILKPKKPLKERVLNDVWANAFQPILSKYI